MLTVRAHSLFFCIYVLLVTLNVHAEDIANVAVVKPTLSEASEQLRYTGTLTADRHSRLSVHLDGLVTEINVDMGSVVKTGDILLELDDIFAKQEVALAEANYNEALTAEQEAERLVEEAKRLRKQNHISATVLAQREASLALNHAMAEAAKAQLATARERLSRHHLKAPFSGVISKKQTEIGEWVARGDTVLELLTVDQVRLDVQVPQEQYNNIQKGMPVDMLVGEQQYTIPADIETIVPVSDPVSRSFLVRLRSKVPSTSLLPGKSAIAIFKIENNQVSQLMIPRDALLHHPDGGYSVFVVRDNKAIRTPVTIGSLLHDHVSVMDGLDKNDVIIIRGNEGLRHEQIVNIVDNHA